MNGERFQGRGRVFPMNVASPIVLKRKELPRPRTEVVKPFPREEILPALNGSERRERLQCEIQVSFEGIIATSPKMAHVFELIRRVANYKTTVLITGESGTGKELVARAIHFNSARRNKPFVAVNCGSIPANLIESELFGHLRGSFTDAVRDKRGLFETADGGTLFLDEVGDLPLDLQGKLLRVLQEEEIRKVGSDKVTQIDVRIVTATVKDLAREVEEGRFRDDLLYRLNVLEIALPPLRDRSEDIPILIEHLLDKHGTKHGLGKPVITEAAVRRLMAHHWPGNVRELENVIERAIILSDDVITPEDLPATVRNEAAPARDRPLSLKYRLLEIEKTLIGNALELSQSDRTEAATLLDMRVGTLRYKIRKYGLGAGTR